MSTQRTIKYKTEDIFSVVMQESMYSAQTQEEEFQPVKPITNDEQDIFRRLLKKAGIEVFKKMHRISADTSIPYDLSWDAATGVDGDIGFTFIEPSHWSATQYLAIDNHMRDAMVAYVLKEWYKMVKADYRYQEAEYQRQMDEINRMTRFNNTATITYRSF